VARRPAEARKTQQDRPTDAELALLNVLWERGPSTVREVHESLPRGVRRGYTTTLKLMQIMVQKGLLARDTSQRSHVYRALSSGQEMQGRLVDDLARRAFQGSSAKLVLRALEGEQAPFRRDISLYHVTVFGTPGGSEPWGWRFQGHHISLNCVIVDGSLVAPLPTFFGSNPAQFGDQRPLAAETDLAREGPGDPLGDTDIPWHPGSLAFLNGQPEPGDG